MVDKVTFTIYQNLLVILDTSKETLVQNKEILKDCNLIELK